jgi:hypothetical protein
MKTLAEILTPAIQDELGLLQWKRGKGHMKPAEFYQAAYFVLAKALLKSGAPLTEGYIDTRLPGMLLRFAIDKEIIIYPPRPRVSRRRSIPSPYLPEIPAPDQSPVRIHRPKLDTKVDDIPVEETPLHLAADEGVSLQPRFFHLRSEAIAQGLLEHSKSTPNQLGHSG